MKYEFKNWTIELPDDYQKIDLAGCDTWIAALESNKYPKGSGALCEPMKNKRRLTYCCLGVKCKIENRLKRNSDGEHCDGGKNAYGIEHLNPDYNVLFQDGTLRYKDSNGSLIQAHAVSPVGSNYPSLASINDVTEDFSIVIWLIKLLFQEPKNS